MMPWCVKAQIQTDTVLVRTEVELLDSILIAPISHQYDTVYECQSQWLNTNVEIRFVVNDLSGDGLAVQGLPKSGIISTSVILGELRIKDFKEVLAFTLNSKETEPDRAFLLELSSRYLKYANTRKTAHHSKELDLIVYMQDSIGALVPVLQCDVQLKDTCMVFATLENSAVNTPVLYEEKEGKILLRNVEVNEIESSYTIEVKLRTRQYARPFLVVLHNPGSPPDIMDIYQFIFMHPWVVARE